MRKAATTPKAPRLAAASWVWLVLASSCARVGFEPWPCEGIDCAGHGICGATPLNAAQCACDPGYRNKDPVTCVRDPYSVVDPTVDAAVLPEGGALDRAAPVDIAADSDGLGDRAGDDRPDAGDAAAVLDAAGPDSGVLDTTASDTTVLDAAVPDAALPDTALPDTALPDNSVADTSVPDSAAPDTSVPDSAAPDTSVPDSAAPDAAPGDAGQQDFGGLPFDLGVQVLAGQQHNCVLGASEEVYCWGFNDFGAVGDGTWLNRYLPHRVALPAAARHIGSDEFNSCAVLTDRRVLCWGYNDWAQLGDATGDNHNAPLEIAGMGDAISVEVGQRNICAVDSVGQIRCLGGNDSGQLGIGIGGGYASTPRLVLEIDTALDMSFGHGHACARLADRSLMCWGYNTRGQLGIGVTGNRSTPVAVPGLSDVSQVSVGRYFACALLGSGQVECWGLGDKGQLGIGVFEDRLSPTPVVGLSTATQISAGRSFMCALLLDGTVACWGANSSGQLGDGGDTDQATPVQVQGVSGAVAVAAGGFHACVIDGQQVLHCWGNPLYGQLGRSPFGAGAGAPVEIAGIAEPVQQLDTGIYRSCAATTAGSVACWGLLYTGANAEEALTPRPVTGLPGAASEVFVGSMHSCARLTDQRVACWGTGNYGQLGNGATASSATPVLVQALVDAVEIAANGYHACARRPDGSVLCWGWNSYGQLGDGTTSNRSAPVPVTGLTPAVGLSLGGGHSCAVLADGSAACWGRNDRGQLGDGSRIDRGTPAPVTGLAGGGGGGVSSLASSGNFSCALLGGGAVRCWGDNDFGQVGDGSVGADALEPQPVVGLAGIRRLAVGHRHACAEADTGDLWCWGLHRDGQLGIGLVALPDYRLTPVSGPALPSPLGALHAGYHQTFAVLSDGRLMGWGCNTDLQLGTGLSPTAGTPAAVFYLADRL